MLSTRWLLALVVVVVVFISVVLPSVTTFVHAHGGHESGGSSVDDSDVVKLTHETFEQHVTSSPITLVEFFAPWCGHCKQLAPHYARAATALKGSVPLASVDCTVEKDLCSEHGVRGFPTLKVFRGDASASTDYKGGRTVDDIVSYMRKQASPSWVFVNSVDSVTNAIRDNDVVIIGIFASLEGADAALFKSAGEKQRESGTFLIATDASLVGGVHTQPITVPAILAFNLLDDRTAPRASVFSGDITSEEALIDFVKAESFPIFGEIGPQNYQRYVDRNLPLVWVFYDPSDANVADQLAIVREVAAGFTGVLSIVRLNGVQYAEHAKHFGLTSNKWPGIAIEDRASQKKFLFPDELNADGLRAFLQSFVDKTLVADVRSQPVPTDNDGPVTVVVGSTFQQIVLDDTKDVFVKFYAPWCGHCKSLAPKWEELGELFADNDNVVIAKFDATENDSPAQIRGFPTLILYPAGAKSSPRTYEGDRTPAAMADFVRANGNTFQDADANADAAPAASSSTEHEDL